MPKRRSRFFATVIIVSFISIVFRLVDLQIIHYNFYSSRAREQRTRIIPIASPRGDIYDRQGRLLATSIDTFSIHVNPKEFRDYESLEKLLGEKIERFSEKKVFAWIKRKISVELTDKIKALNIPGVYFMAEKKRIYPKGRLASQIIGFVGLDNEGLSGVELGLDDYLKGEETSIVAESDPAGYELLSRRESKKKKYQAGMDVYLTIDETVQYIAERELAKTVKQYGGISGQIIVMDVKSGELLAVAGWPDFDPNDYKKADPRVWRSKSIDVYEPGSTFKAITMACGLDEGVINLETKLKALDKLEIGGKIIENSHKINFGGPTVTISKMLEQSINTAVAQIGIMLGKDRFYKKIRDFGFGDPVNVGLVGESRGIVRPPESWYAPDVAMVSFGQSIAVSPFQMCAAYTAIANGGMLIRPQLVKKIESDDLSFIKTSRLEEIKRSISKKTSEDALKILENVVLHGSGRKARMDYYRIGGKTGTAQKAMQNGIGYMKGHYIASFIGIAPISDPRIVAIVIVDDPRATIWGETVAGPTFKTIVENTLRYFNAKPDTQPTQEAVKL